MQSHEYIKLAEVEDSMWYFRSLHGHIHRELLPLIPGNPRVLDAGCGTGGLILRLRRWWPGGQFSGIDFSALACDLARQRCGAAVDIREASITALPFENDSFGTVVSADVICQVDNAGDAVAEFFRVLRPGGVALINVPAYMWMWSYHDDSCETKHRYTRPEIRALVEAAGGEILRLTHWNALPFPAVWAKRKLFRSAKDTSDVKRYSPLVERAADVMIAAEHGWLRGGHNWAWGTSILAVARKRDA